MSFHYENNLNNYKNSMTMFRKKIYGKSKIEPCPFCGKTGTAQNKQGITVCREHKEAILNDMRCTCGDMLDIKIGKYGYFFVCMRCGAKAPRKVYEINDVKDISKRTAKCKPEEEKQQ